MHVTNNGDLPKLRLEALTRLVKLRATARELLNVGFAFAKVTQRTETDLVVGIRNLPRYK